MPEYLRNVIERGLNEKPEERPTLEVYRSVISGKTSVVSTNHLAKVYVRILKTVQSIN